MMHSAVYLYCLVQARKAPSLARVRGGVPGAGPVRLVDAGRSLWLIAADVPLAQYGEEALEGGLRDFEWVSRCAIGHEALVESFIGATAVVPMKLFTLFTTDTRAVAHVSRRRRTIDRTLARIANSQEWGVRVTQSVKSTAGPGPAATSRRSSGTDFLRRKQQARQAVRDHAERAQAAASRYFLRLKAHAREARRLPRAPAPGTRAPLLDAAFLVKTTGAAGFRSTVQRMARELAPLGCEITLTGPWPAYNFVKTQ